MKSQGNIYIAFALNLVFSIFECIGGLLTGSVAIISDAVHDLGDAASIGLACLLEKKSRRQPDGFYTYGYARYSVLGGMITTLILLLGSVAVIWGAVGRLLNPTPIHYDGMILLAVIGALVNIAAAYFTRGGDSVNQKAVNLHMLEDVLGWLVVLAGAVVMRFSHLYFLDPLMSIGVAVYILCHAVANLRHILAIILEKVPAGMSVEAVREKILALEGVRDVHHIHIRTLDGNTGCATMHIVTVGDPCRIKEQVRQSLKTLGIAHTTLELEREGETCHAPTCQLHQALPDEPTHHHHHHH